MVRQARTLAPDDIRVTRLVLGYTQDSLGSLVGVTQPEVSRWESGQRAPERAAEERIRVLATGTPRVVVQQARGPYRVRQLVLPAIDVWELPLLRWSEEQRAAEARRAAERAAAEERKRAAAEARRQAAEERRRAAVEAAEARRARAEERRREAADEKRRAAEERRQVAAEAKVRKAQKQAACRTRIKAEPYHPAPTCETYDRVCYPTKGQAARAFLAYPLNTAAYEAAGAWQLPSEGGEWDSVNDRYELRGKRRVQTLGQAVAAVIPGRPYCLDRMDLEALNDTGAAQEVGGFSRPLHVVEQRYSVEEQAYYEQLQAERGEAAAAPPNYYVDDEGALYVEGPADAGAEAPF